LQSFGHRLTNFAPWALALAAAIWGLGLAIWEPGRALGQEKTAAQEKTTTNGNSATPAAPAALPGKAGDATQPAPQPTADKPPGAAEHSTDKSSAVVEEPPVYYVRDQQGRLVPLLGFSYEEILDFLAQKKAGQPLAASKEYSLEQLVIEGEASGDHADLTADFKIHLAGTDWVNVPLMNHGAVLAEPLAFHGEAEHQLQFDSQTGSYTLRLHGAAGSEQQVSLKLVVPVKTLAAQHRLELDVPAATASRFTLEVPQAPIELTSHAGCTLAELKSPTMDAKNRSRGSAITLWGLAGLVSLAWQQPTASSSAILEATGQVFAQIDSRSVQFDASLTVRGFGAQFDKFHIKLPPGAQLTGGAPTGANYTLTMTGDQGATASTGGDGNSSSGNQSEAKWVEVQLAQPTSEPVDIHLQAERAYDVTKPNQPLELAGFEIQEAAQHRQWGHLAVGVVGDWQLAWGERNRVRQIAELPEALQRKGLVAGFEYFGQPASLTARVIPRRTRSSVEPEYVYYVEPRQLRLEARLKYTIRGAKTSTLEISLPNWEIDECGPSDVVDINAAPANRPAGFTIPLLEATSGEIEITLKAHRAIPADASHLEIAIPLPAADVVNPALVAIVPADNIRLRPREDELQGLIRPSVAPRLTLPAREQASLFYRGEQPQAMFVADMERLPQAIHASAYSEVNLARDEVKVEQRFHFRVEHEPAASLTFDVPAALLTGSPVEWSRDGQTLTAPSPGSVSSDSSTARLELALPEAQLGAFEIVAQYQVPFSQLAAVHGAMTAGRLHVPLIMPAVKELEHNQATIRGEPAARIQSLDDAWTVDQEPVEVRSGVQRPALQLTAAAPTTKIALAWRPGTHESSTTVVDRAWVQSWISGAVRQDRAVYHFTTTADEFVLSPPAGASVANLELQLDHRLLPAASLADGTLKVKLPPESESQPHVLEMRYQWANAAAGPHTLEINLPHFPEGVWVQRMYWQLVLPSDEQLLDSPAELTPEYAWKWSGLGWSRQATWDQSDLEKWADATAEDPLPEATNRYLFSALGNPPKIVARFVARWQMLFVPSAAALALGLFMMYVSAGRRPWLLFAAGVILIVLAAAAPDIALLVAQGAGVGCILILFARLLQHALLQHRSLGKVVPAGSSSIVDRSSVQRKVRPLEFAGASTAHHSELEMPPAESESE
jgi:hypothetical protein